MLIKNLILEDFDLDLLDMRMGLDGEEDESYDPVYASRALLEQQDREKAKNKTETYDNDEYYRWDDPLTDHAENRKDPSRRQWGEAQ